MAEKLYLTAGSWSVTAGAVTTPRRTFRLEHVQALRLSKPLFIFSVIGASLVGFHLAIFHDVLTQTEMAGAGLVTMLVVAACSQFGRLTITAAGPRGEFSDEMLGWWLRLRRVRHAIDQALDAPVAANAGLGLDGRRTRKTPLQIRNTRRSLNRLH